MINSVIIEGIVVKTWSFKDDAFLRIATYRDPDLPQRTMEGNESKEKADYVTIRVSKGYLGGGPVAFKPKERIRVHGYMQSRDYQETLHDFLKDASVDWKPQDVDTANVKANRSLTEVVAQKIIKTDNGKD